LDAIAISIAVATAVVSRFGWTATSRATDYIWLAVVLVPAWVAAMATSGAYDQRFFPAGTDQYRRVLNGGVWLLALVAFVSFALHADVSRAFVLLSLPGATVLTLIGRFAARKKLHRAFTRGEVAHRILAIGSPREISDLVVHAHRARSVGMQVIAALVPGGTDRPPLPAGVAYAGSEIAAAVEAANLWGADTIAVAGSHLLGEGALQRLAWELEGSDIDLAVVPSITDIAGPRISVRPIDGLPLLDVAKPQFSGIRGAIKTTIDRALAGAALLALSPLLLLVAFAVVATSPGGALFRQRRIGQGGRPFDVLKFRSMYVDPSRRAPGFSEGSEQPLKSRRDPRVTPLGRILRRTSIDELPQLWNVLRGEMSIVGPRPLVPDEGELLCGPNAFRRLLVKPGITGLWQVSGRSDVCWEERARLDLHYVDNWSVGLDVALIMKTFASVVRGRGAY
jgi:exopolysaccharide biosynthesis polyprenyl glycosylphosphotransferase